MLSSPHRAPWSLARILRSATVTGTCIAGLAWIIQGFPLATWWLAAFAAIYALVLCWRRDAWLVLLPPLLVGVDLTPWSGRWLFTELDVAVLVTLAVVAWDRRRRAAVVDDPARVRHVVVALSVLAWGIATVIGMEGRWPPPFDEFAVHHGMHEGLRPFKALLYAVLLLPAFSRACSRRQAPHAETLLAFGFCLALFVVGLEVAWDRGVGRHLVSWHGFYALADDLLDVTSTYRTTAAFAGMHTGGAPLDTFLMLALPFAMVLLAVVRRWSAAVLAVAGLVLGGYALLGTFTRASYAGFALSLLVLGGLWLSRARHDPGVSGRRLLLVGVLLVLVLGTAVTAYQLGGFQVLASGALALIAGVILALAPGAPRARLALLAVAVPLLGVVAFDGVSESKWHADLPRALAIAVACGAAALGLAGWWLGRLGAGMVPRATAIILGVALGAGLVLAVPAAGGYRMEARLGQVDQDLSKRGDHIRDVLALRRTDLAGVVFGAGTGSFARRYFWTHVDDRTVGSVRFDRDGEASALRLGVGHYNVMQRVDVRPGVRYELRMRARAEGGAVRVDVKLCHKNVLYSERWTPDCPLTVETFEPEQGWREFRQPIDAGTLGRHGWLYWPVTLMLHRSSGGGVLAIDRVQLLDPDGKDLVANGRFEQGSDRWFFISDFHHLPWHAKNVVLHLFVEQGIVGVLAALVLVVAVLRRALALRSGRPLMPAAVLAALPALGALGMFATMLDEPRVVLLIYLVLFAMLWLPPAPGTAGSTRPDIDPSPG